MGVYISQTRNAYEIVATGGDIDTALATIGYDTVTSQFNFDKEVNFNAGVAAPVVIVVIANGANTLTPDATTHANRVCFVLDATFVVTLPEATGSGDVYTFVQGIAATTSSFVTADTTNADLIGSITATDSDSAGTVKAWRAGSSDNTVTYDGTAKGGKLGDWVSFTDLATDVWLVDGMVSQSGGSEATPFSDA